MRLLAGTSGFSYKEWVGAFYPDKLAAKDMLAHYATRLPIVEINNTFYRMPNAASIQSWRSQVPDSFRFAIKVPRRISHIKRLRDCGEDLAFLLRAVADLSPCLGSLLVQLPPYARCDEAALASFLSRVPEGTRAAFEFRNDSWHVPAVFKLLESRNAALVQSESDETFEPLPRTADWAYLRLRRVDYTTEDLHRWLERIDASGVTEAQVFFKHEDGATGPKLAAQLLAMADRR
ncbi:MAG TPA: DUF72 domain-containing protein [Gammaproteobacteria bacterium]|nr:DUF72 domain-containing protein [Gammaproteobacteria bacterium]